MNEQLGSLYVDNKTICVLFNDACKKFVCYYNANDTLRCMESTNVFDCLSVAKREINYTNTRCGGTNEISVYFMSDSNSDGDDERHWEKMPYLKFFAHTF